MHGSWNSVSGIIPQPPYLARCNNWQTPAVFQSGKAILCFVA